MLIKIGIILNPNVKVKKKKIDIIRLLDYNLIEPMILLFKYALEHNIVLFLDKYDISSRIELNKRLDYEGIKKIFRY